MKKFLIAFAALTSLCWLSACGSTQSTVVTAEGGLVRGSFQESAISVKDYEPVQLVFAETQVGASGANMTYDALLREAAKVQADAIINVVIEDVQVCESNQSGFFSKSACVTTRYGSALAIRYTRALTYDDLPAASRPRTPRPGVMNPPAPPAGAPIPPVPPMAPVPAPAI